jgi:hypothetical protein
LWKYKKGYEKELQNKRNEHVELAVMEDTFKDLQKKEDPG